MQTVVQIGSPKSLARLLRRAGRSAHLPGDTSRLLFMLANALELLEVSAVRAGLTAASWRSGRLRVHHWHVLLQHLTILACGVGFRPERALEVVRHC